MEILHFAKQYELCFIVKRNITLLVLSEIVVQIITVHPAETLNELPEFFTSQIYHIH